MRITGLRTLLITLVSMGLALPNSPAAKVVLHNFAAPSNGAHPEAGVIRDAEGSLYGTTLYGGASGYGVVYEIGASGQETVLHSFTGG